MKKMWKGGVLFVLCVLCLYTANEAKATSKTSDEAINWVKSQVGNSIDADGAYGAQCVDLIRAYYNFLGVAQVRGNGCDYATNQLPSGWTRIKGAQPQKGDILVYTGGYGHVAIYESDYVTYHQNYNGKKKVTREAFADNSPAYITNYTPYWGVVRPNFSSGNIGAYGEMITPTIQTDKEVYNVGETANISWAATSPNSDFYQYWLIIVNETTKQQIFGGDPGVARNPAINSKSLVLPSAGRYYIKIYSVPFNNKESRQKLATKYISVGAYGEMTTPTIQTDKEIYNVGENVKISWKATSANSDFAQYWLVIVNETTKQKVYGGDPGVAQNPSVNQKTVTLSSAGRYYIKIYSVPFYGKESRQKLATKYISVGAYGEMTTPTIQTDKEIYNVGENVKISWKATSANSDFAQYWLVIVNETTKQKVYGGDPGVAQNPSVNQKTVTLSSAGRYYIKIYSVPFYGKESRQKMATKYIEVSNKTYTSANNVTESKLDTIKEQVYRKTGMTQAEIKKSSSKKGCLKLFLGKVTGAKGY